MPRFRIVGRHTEALFHSRLQLVEQVGIDSNAGCDHEVTVGRLSLEADVSQLTKSDLARVCRECRTRCGDRMQRYAQVMRKCIGCPKRQNRQRYRSSGDPLDDIMNGAVAATGEHRVASLCNCLTCLCSRLVAGLCGNDRGIHPRVTQYSKCGIQLRMAAFATGPRVVEQPDVFHRQDRSLPNSPLPHAKHGLLIDGMPNLSSQHRDLSSMMRIVSDQISKECGNIGPKALYASIGCKRRLQYVG